MSQGIANLRNLRRNPHIVAASLCANLLGLALPIALIQIYDRVIPREGYQTLLMLALGLLTAAVADFAVRSARGSLIANGGMRFEAIALRRAFRRIFDSRFGSTYADIDQGQLHDRIESINRVRRHHGSEAAAALLDIPFIGLFIAIMTLISPVLGATICLIALFSIALVWKQRTEILKLSVARQERDQKRHSFLIETLEGIEMVKSLGIEEPLLRRYERLMSVSAEITRDMSGRINFTQGVTSAIGLMAPVVMSGVGSWLVIEGKMSVGGVAASVLLTGRVIQPLLKIEALLAGERDISRAEIDVRELTEILTPEPGAPDVHKIYEIALSDVSVSLGEDTRDVIRNATISLRAGDCVALSGEDGSGRTVLLSLLAGLIEPRKGEVHVNGVPKKYVRASSISQRISFLSPDHTLLEGSLLENLTAFEPHRYQEKAFSLAQELGIDEFISRHSDGLSLRVAARAANSLPKSIHDGVILISGLCKEPDVILFDEANSGLDRHIDGRLIEMLRRRKPGCIIIMVSHRPSYLNLANRRIELRNGALIEHAVAHDGEVAA